MKRIIERILIKLAKYLNVDLLAHAHIQIGVGHNTYVSGEEYVIDVILPKALKKNPSVVFDIGANVGKYAIVLQKKFQDAKIYCFEPVFENFEKLKQNTAGLNIDYQNVALGSEVGTIKLYKGANDNDGSMVTAYKETLNEIFDFAGKPGEFMEVKLTTVDSFCGDEIRSIDFLKIDVEGHELEVLKGAVKLINGDRINIIQFEFNEFNIFSKSFLLDFYRILPNYDFYRIMPQNKLYPLKEYSSVNEIFMYQNILAINKSLKYNYAG